MKTLTTDRGPAQTAGQASPLVPRTWEDFSHLYPIYEALTKECNLPSGPYPGGPASPQWPSHKERDLQWLDEVDRHAQAVHLRRFLATPAAASENGLRLLVQRHLSKLDKLRADRDKIDLLVVQYFVLCAPQEVIAGPAHPSDVAEILRPALGDVKPARLAFCKELDRILSAAQQSHRLRDLMEQGLLEQGKLVKEAAGVTFYHPTALVWFCRFNFLLRRSFFQWLHADLRAIGVALNELERKGVKFVDCRRAGLSAAEPMGGLRQFHERWRPPVQADYSQDSAFRPYEQLMSLREDLEEALGRAAAPPVVAPAPELATGQKQNAEVAPASPRDKPAAASTPKEQSAPSPSISPHEKAKEVAKPVSRNTASAAASVVPNQAVPAAGPIDIETLEEKIWEQLIASPPARGRSMTTVAVENTRLLLSAWEVAAFISESGNDSEELRRVIVARAMLSTAIERWKRLLDFRTLEQAVAHARTEVPRFQERVDQFKRNSKTDAAVNLGISLKRLLSLIEEAEDLQKGNKGQPKKR